MKLFEQEEQTSEDKLQEYVGRIKTIAQRELRRFSNKQRTIFNMIWNSEFTPQEVLDKFGTDAKELFIASKAAEDYQKLALGESYEPLEVPYEFTINADGTVTVGDKIEEDLPVVEEPII